MSLFEEKICVGLPTFVVDATSTRNVMTYGELRAGDALCYDTGAIFVIEEIAMQDRDIITFVVRCIVAPPDAERSYPYGAICVQAAFVDERLRPDIQHVRS